MKINKWKKFKESISGTTDTMSFGPNYGDQELKNTISTKDTSLIEGADGVIYDLYKFQDLYISIKNIQIYLILTEIIKNQNDPLAQLYYWQRESKSSQAEVDYVFQNNFNIIPIEVKAGTKGAMQSMYKFIEEKNVNFGIRTSLENYGELEKIKIVPIYAFGIMIKAMKS
jgi:predicted AAA+ superfamily ATPase